MTLYVVVGMIMSVVIALALNRMNLSLVWCIAVAALCFIALLLCGILLVKDMDAPPPGSTEITQEELNRAAGIE
jgi:hypothetical protein